MIIFRVVLRSERRHRQHLLPSGDAARRILAGRRGLSGCCRRLVEHAHLQRYLELAEEHLEGLECRQRNERRALGDAFRTLFFELAGIAALAMAVPVEVAVQVRPRGPVADIAPRDQRPGRSESGRVLGVRAVENDPVFEESQVETGPRIQRGDLDGERRGGAQESPVALDFDGGFKGVYELADTWFELLLVIGIDEEVDVALGVRFPAGGGPEEDDPSDEVSFLALELVDQERHEVDRIG
jgi:hypothetical protein